MKIRAILIGDESISSSLIGAFVERIPYLKLMGTFKDPLDALELTRRGEVDLIYLNVSRSDSGGMDFVKSLASPPKVIFISDQDTYAMQAFELNAADYLLKPISFSRFLFAAEKVFDLLSPKLKRDDFIFVKAEHNIIKVELKAIQFIEGYKDYLKIHTDMPKPILTITTFKAIEGLLPSNFVRIHKSYIVSINKIVSFRNGKVYVKDRSLPIGDTYRDIFNREVIQGRLT